MHHGRSVGADQNTDWRALAASTLEWWHDAGIDTLVEDDPRDWFAAVVPSAPVSAPQRDIGAGTPAAPVAGSEIPSVFTDFLNWRTGPLVPEAAWNGPWIAASGPADARVMVLADCPERDDTDCLMGGAEGRLFDRMLAAIGLSRDTIHLAAVCAKRPTAGRVAPDAEGRLAEIARHHIDLVAPDRVLLIGNAASRAILGMDAAVASGNLHPFNHKTGTKGPTTIGVVASLHPRFLIEKPAMKAQAWRDLQLLTGGLAA